MLLRLAIVLIFATFPMSVMAQEIHVGHFSAGNLEGWEAKEFKGKTVYSLVDDKGRTVLKADANATASGLFKKVEIDPRTRQTIQWSWKVNRVLDKGDARTKEGDDYPARIYVVFKGSVFWKTTGLNYIWANRLPQGDAVPNAYAKKNVIMLAVESGPGKLGQWVSEERNVFEDYQRLFGKEPPKIEAIAVMTDADNTGESVTAWYGDIIFR
jgi:hypothetical protein